MSPLTIICLSIAIAMATAAVPADEITSLPGLMKQPFFKQYSGYLKATGTRMLHYWFVESESNPATDPVVLWLNGGPGCSSVLGILTENGPFRVMPDGMTVTYNEFSWNKMTNVLYLEAPAGVGFSYSDDKNYTFTDDTVSLDNYMALKDFFMKYPEYAQNEFFVTGESYGGIYVPTLSQRVLDDPAFNFIGFAIGNGICDYSMNTNSLLYFTYYHGVLGEMAWGDLIKNCCGGNSSRCNFTANIGVNTCRKAIAAAEVAIGGSGLNIYNLYAECVNGMSGNGLRFNQQLNKFEFSEFGWPLSQSPKVQAQRKMLKKYQLGKLMLTPPCINATNIIVYLTQSSVRQALHIPSQALAWTPCSTEVNMKYQSIYASTKEFYMNILGAGKRALVYNGDVDMAVNFLGDEWFVDSLDLPLMEDRKAWYYMAKDGTTQVAGFVKQFKGLTFTTIRGAGHMVPTDRPAPAFMMYTNFIKNTPY